MSDATAAANPAPPLNPIMQTMRRLSDIHALSPRGAPAKLPPRGGRATSEEGDLGVKYMSIDAKGTVVAVKMSKTIERNGVHFRWEPRFNGVGHVIDFYHGLLLGERKIKVDLQTISKSRKLIDSGSKHEFDIAFGPQTLRFTVTIEQQGLAFDYLLKIALVPDKEGSVAATDGNSQSSDDGKSQQQEEKEYALEYAIGKDDKALVSLQYGRQAQTRKYKWKVVYNGVSRVIELEHGTVFGLRKITVDGVKIIKARKFLDGGSAHTLSVDFGNKTLHCTIKIRPNGLSFDYSFALRNAGGQQLHHAAQHDSDSNNSGAGDGKENGGAGADGQSNGGGGGVHAANADEGLVRRYSADDLTKA